MIPIAFVIDSVETPNAGTEKQLLLLIEGLHRRYFSPHLIVLRRSDWLKTTPLSCPVFSLELDSLLSIRFFPALWAFRRYCMKNGIRIVQTFFRDANLVGTLGARLANVGTVISSRRSYGFGYWHNRYWLLLLRGLDLLTDSYLANSYKTAAYTIEAEKTSPEKVKVVYNGIDLDQFHTIRDRFRDETRRRLGVSPDEVLIGAVANLRPVKNIQLLVEVAERLFPTFRQVRFVVIGEGDQRRLLEKQIASAGLSSVFRLIGRQPDVRPYLAAMDIAVLCSNSESLSNAIVEYMAAGLPCVVSDVGGNAEAIGMTRGLTFATGDVEGLRRCLKKLIAKPALRCSLGYAARKYAYENYPFQKMLQKHETIYHRLVTCRIGN